MQSSQPSQCAAVDGWDGRKEAFVRPTVRTSLIQLARAFEEEGGKKGGGRERGGREKAVSGEVWN